jgi:hypothetical protein
MLPQKFYQEGGVSSCPASSASAMTGSLSHLPRYNDSIFIIQCFHCIQTVYSVTFSVYTCAYHCKENPIFVFLFWELRGLSPNFHINVSVSDLYIPRIGPHISLQQNMQTILGIYEDI